MGLQPGLRIADPQPPTPFTIRSRERRVPPAQRGRERLDAGNELGPFIAVRAGERVVQRQQCVEELIALRGGPRGPGEQGQQRPRGVSGAATGGQARARVSVRTACG
jgi:hypothetical protein